MKKIVLIAHDKMKPEMAAFIKQRQDWLWGRELVATGRTAEHMEAAQFKIPIHHLSMGRSGGYLEIVSLLKKSEVGMVFSSAILRYEKPLTPILKPWLKPFLKRTFPWHPTALLLNCSSLGRLN
jgi:methylglyoxal synthase